MSATITDEDVQALSATAKPFSLLELRSADRDQAGAEDIEREHQRRMMSLRADRVIAILCPVLSDSVAGVAVFSEPVEAAQAIMAEDPCVQAGMMTFKVLPCLSFPGDTLPE